MSGILNLPGLRELDKKESETEYHVKAEPAAIARLCPHCGELHRHRQGNRECSMSHQATTLLFSAAPVI